MKVRPVKLIFLLLLFCVFVSKAQDQQAVAEDTTVYRFVETQPEFPGGLMGLTQYFQHNLKYPESALYKRKEGRSVIEFVVNKDGSISSAKTFKGFDDACDQEACRLVSAMPAWKPGMKSAKFVRVRVYMPIVFRLPIPNAFELYRAPENKPLVFTTPETSGEDNSVHSFVEQQPEYTGGPEAMYKFIQTNLKYPGRARRMGTEGKTFVQFIVNKDGNLSDVAVIKGFSTECDAEAQRVISIMPAWIPGKQNGKTVRVKYVLPINFRLSDPGRK